MRCLKILYWANLIRRVEQDYWARVEQDSWAKRVEQDFQLCRICNPTPLSMSIWDAGKWRNRSATPRTGQPAVSPGQRPGYVGNTHKRPERAKALLCDNNAFALTGRTTSILCTRGAAPGWLLTAHSGRLMQKLKAPHTIWSTFGLEI